MYFSTYRRIAYVGLVFVPIFFYAVFLAISGDVGVALGWTALLTIILVPAQLWQLGRMQSRLDDYGGSMPLGWAFDWDLIDDTDDDEPPAPGLGPSATPTPSLGSPERDSYSPLGSSSSSASAIRTCPSCGMASAVSGERYCPFCGGSMTFARAM